jgi:hypothetical protein
MPSWLREVGVCLQFGHSGDPCPNQIVRHKAFYALNPIENCSYRWIYTVRKNARAAQMKF